MKLLFKQRLFSLLDSYDIYDASGATVYTVRDQLALGHLLNIYDADGSHIATVRQKIPYFFPKFNLEIFGVPPITMVKELAFLRHRYALDGNGWTVEGSFMEWDYTIKDGARTVATIKKELWNLTDTYVIDVAAPEDALCALMVVLAIDAEKCSRD